MAQEIAPIEYEQFVLLGDSITEYSTDQSSGFSLLSALQLDYIRRYDVVMRGYSGYTSEQGLWAFERFFPSAEKVKVNLMTIWYGANDACLPGNFQHVPLENYKASLKQIIQHPSKANQKTKFVLLTPPPINEHQLEPDSARTTWHTRKYAEACKEVGAELNVPVVDVWTLFMHYAGWKEGQPLEGSKDVPANPKLAALFTDGLHLTAQAYKLVYAELKKTIKERYPEEAAENMPAKFAPWTEAPRPRIEQ
ncbi:hypothetical protein KEM56_002321 [Ascosphaera pollenicola]|nr:hypothetical protein KEM56_002321 [Ascosphaera pollenicola]